MCKQILLCMVFAGVQVNLRSCLYIDSMTLHWTVSSFHMLSTFYLLKPTTWKEKHTSQNNDIEWNGEKSITQANLEPLQI